MPKILGTFDSRMEAQQAVNRLVTVGIDSRSLSIAANDPGAGGLKKALYWGMALGAGIVTLSPRAGLFYLIGHHAPSAILAFLATSAKGMFAGAAIGGAIGLLLSGVERRKSFEWATPDSGRFALTLEDDWISFQRARAFVEAEQSGIDPSLIELVSRFGYEHQSFVSLYGEHEVWRIASPEAAVIYRRVGRLVVVGGAPLTARENLQATTALFLEFCRGQNLDCVMIPIGSEAAAIVAQCGMGLLKIGESGYFKLPDWRPAGDRAKKVRAGVNQARKAGIVVERYDPGTNPDCELRIEIESLCQRWLDTREVEPLGWLFELDPFQLSEHKRYFLARKKEERVEAMLACCPIPARKGWYLEDLIRLPDAERGVSELLVVEALAALADEGAKLATLATSPLAGGSDPGDFKIVSWALNLISQRLEAFYHFKALHRFKSKFAPSFVDSEFAAVYPPRIRLSLILGLIRILDPGGIRSVLASKFRRLRRERPN